MFKKIIEWFKSLFKSRYTKEYNIIEVKNFLDLEIEKGTIYHLKEYGVAKFQCPCGCGFIESLEIGKKVNIKEQIWTINVKDDRPTVMNSVWTKAECNSHYWIKDGKVEWA